MYKITNQLENIGFSINLVSDIIKRNNYNKRFNTLDYYNIYLMFEDFKISVSGKIYEVKGGNAVFIGPQKDVEFYDAHQKEIYVIAFSSDFYDRSSKDSLFLNSQVFYNFHSEVFIAPYFGDTDYNKIVLIERLSKFKNKNESLYISAAHNTIEALILDAYIYIEEHHGGNDEKLMFVSHVNRFIIMLQRDFKTAKKVLYYADALNLSARRLTEMCEYVYGKAAKQLIIDKVKLECEKAIKYSDMTISEISYDMGFSDEGNFSNFIKKHTGRNPSELRLFTVE